jgi:pimeloyl-ACP methyl ester carboxylesterase
MQKDQIALVLIHGHGVDASIWSGIYAELVSEATVLKPDFSRLTNHITIEGYAEELLATIQAARLEKVILVGHSMGGYIALAFAEQHPDMIQALVLYHSTALADDENRKQTRRQAIEEMQTKGAEPFIQKQMPKMVAPTYLPEKTQDLINRYQQLPAEAMIAGMAAMAGRPDRTQVLRQAKFPVLVVLGRDDQVIPYEKAVQLADLSNQVSIATIEQAGHLSMVEQPQQSIQVLKTFIAQV